MNSWKLGMGTKANTLPGSSAEPALAMLFPSPGPSVMCAASLGSATEHWKCCACVNLNTYQAISYKGGGMELNDPVLNSSQ